MSDPSANIDRDYHFFQSSFGKHVFLTDRSQIFDVDDFTGLETVLDEAEKVRLGTVDALPEVRSISLNVAQGCNLGCGYCYAEQGGFGGASKIMSSAVAKQTINLLLEEAAPGSQLLIGFMGGEPMLARQLIHEIVPYATERGTDAGHDIRFSMTTNGTLIKPEDVALFARYPFAIQISIDGDATVQNRNRPTKSGNDSYHMVEKSMRLFREVGHPRALSARATVEADCDDIYSRFVNLKNMGFDEVGFSPVVTTPSGIGAMDSDDLSLFLQQMITCGQKILPRLLEGQQVGFTNLETALMELHRGTHRPYSCGAGAAYLSASADGDLFACHRLINDDDFAMGSIAAGYDDDARADHLESRHVDRSVQCSTCWARYLCGGGCHQEVHDKGRVSCDYIRGWLSYCLSAYTEMNSARPEYFTAAQTGSVRHV